MKKKKKITKAKNLGAKIENASFSLDFFLSETSFQLIKLLIIFFRDYNHAHY